MVEMTNKNEAKSETSMIFTQLKTYEVFNGVVIGFGLKGLSGKVCDSVR